VRSDGAMNGSDYALMWIAGSWPVYRDLYAESPVRAIQVEKCRVLWSRLIRRSISLIAVSLFAKIRTRRDSRCSTRSLEMRPSRAALAVR